MRTRWFSAVSALALISSFGAVSAASAAEPVGGDPPEVEEIVVTAERRESTLQDTPIALNAVGGQQIETRGIQSLERLSQSVPNVRFNTVADQAVITIRGIGARTNNAGGDPSVAFHIDGVYISRLAAANGSFFDLERVEVLRGPQGTLYGRNATGGAINVISRAPTVGEWSGRADAVYGSYDRKALRAALNIPVGETAALRVSGLYDVRDGYVKQLGAGDDRNDDRNSQIKAQLRWTPNENIDLIIRSTFTRKWGSGPSQKLLTINRPVFGSSLTAPPPAGYGVGPLIRDPYVVNENEVARLRTESSVQSATLVVDNLDLGPLGPAQWTSIVAYQDFSESFTNDNDGTEVFIANNKPFTQTAEQWTAETRLASQSDGAFDWMVGAYYLSEDATDDIIAQIRLPIGVVLNAAPYADGESRSYAAFGQGTFHIDDRWSVTGGLRYTHDEKTTASLPSLGPRIFTYREDSWSAVTGKLGVQFRPSEGLLYYGSVSRGYKAGGYALNQPAFDPEFIWAYELGAKATLFDRRLVLNTSAFYYDYTDLQVPELVGLTQIIRNAASAEIKGVELDAVLRLTSELRVDASLSWLEAKFSDFTLADEAFPAAGPVDLSGQPLPNSPKWSGSFGVEYRFDLEGLGSLTPRIDIQWTSKYRFRPFGVEPYDVQEGYAKVDFNIHWEDQEGRLFVDVFGSNIGDKTTYNSVLVNSLVNQWQAVVASPSMYGVRLGYSF